MLLTVKEEKELYQEDHPFRQVMDTLFDAGLILDREGKIIYASKNAFPHLQIEAAREEIIGEPAEWFDKESPFRQVLETGKPVKGFVLHNALNKSNISHIFPIFCEGKTAGLLCIILIDNLNNIKKMLMGVEGWEQNIAKELYNDITRHETTYTFADFIGESPVIQDMIATCKKAAATEYPILITGETGTGKEIIANGFHVEAFGTGKKPLVKINCTAIPDMLLESELFGHEKGAFTGATARKRGKFELAENGTILLDEIEAMDLRLQGKLLRVLEEKEFERVGGLKIIPLRARIIASSNQNLKELADQGKFRADLYYRLNIIEIKIPTLRERRGDIPLLIRHFEKQQGQFLGFSDEAMQLLLSYEWRGNVRELRNMMVKLSITCGDGTVQKKDVQNILGIETRMAGDTKPDVIDLGSAEKESLLRALEQNNYHVTKSASQLGISRTSFYYKLKKYGIELKRN